MQQHDDDYFDYSADDASPNLLSTLEYFFSNEKHAYRYGLAKKHYEDLRHHPTIATSKRIFTIITGTNLVTNRLVLSYRTAQGVRYKIKKSYVQTIDRHKRSTSRDQARSQQSTSSSFVQQESSGDGTIHSNTAIPKRSEFPKMDQPKPPVPNTPTPTHENLTPGTTKSIPRNITEQAAELQRDMDDALDSLTNADSNDISQPLMNTIQQLIHDEIQRSMKPFEENEKAMYQQINAIRASCDLMDKRVHSQFSHIVDRIKTLEETHQRYDSIINRFTQNTTETITNIENKISKYENDTDQFIQDTTEAVTDIDNKVTKCENTVHDFVQDITHTIDNLPHSQSSKLTDYKTHIDHLQTDLNNVQLNIKKRIGKIKTTTTEFFKHHDEDLEILHDRVHRLEEDFAHMKRRVRTPVTKQLKFDTSSDDQSELPTPRPSVSPSYEPPSSYNNTQSNHPPRPSVPYQTPSKFGPDMEYLRKNINITCTEQNQILEFYIKLRLAVAKGGIYLKPIEDITREHSIAQNNLNKEANLSQSNALYTLLSNEKYIPADFTMAQNCILGYSTTMDGFAALKAMLKLTHPVLNKKRPSNIPPTMSDTTDIHSYEQTLRNYYLLHRLFSNTEHSAIEKSRQFLKGLSDDRYNEAVTRVQHQLDTTELMKISLPDDFTLDNIASTIINITNEYVDDDVVVVRAMKTQTHHGRHNNKRTVSRPPHKYSSNTTPSFTPRNRYTKIQCHACQKFGHMVTHCTLLPLVLAILQFQSKNRDQCNNVLQKHITQNSVSSKKTFVRALQHAAVLSDDCDSDTHMEDDIVLHSIMDNDIHIDDLQSLE